MSEIVAVPVVSMKGALKGASFARTWAYEAQILEEEFRPWQEIIYRRVKDYADRLEDRVFTWWTLGQVAGAHPDTVRKTMHAAKRIGLCNIWTQRERNARVGVSFLFCGEACVVQRREVPEGPGAACPDVRVQHARTGVAGAC